MEHAQALQIAKKLALWADFLMNYITHDLFLLPTFIYRASWYQVLSQWHRKIVQKKGCGRQHWAFVSSALGFCEPANQDKGSGESREPYPHFCH